ncbi:hypothetical protein [Metallibacterium sp.]|uniref:hypothetical protein n=1 Tax=Metallibacterium sp. TaxID=2940281 RepID=UPI002637C5E8|nr:hypothetical protein [Metallibacterium sp.]
MATEILDVMGKIGSFCGLLALPYLVLQNVRSRPKFSFDFHGSSGKHTQLPGVHQYRYEVQGTLKNRSLDPNAIIKIYLVAWANKSKTSYLRNGFGGLTVNDDASKQPLSLPLRFEAREAKGVQVVFEIPVTGTVDERILSEHEPIVPGASVLRQKNEYELCFEDINGNLFDATGLQINSAEAALRWTLPNTVRQFQDGRTWPFFKHYTQILRAKMKFRTRLVAQALGFWR